MVILRSWGSFFAIPGLVLGCCAGAEPTDGDHVDSTFRVGELKEVGQKSDGCLSEHSGNYWNHRRWRAVGYLRSDNISCVSCRKKVTESLQRRLR